MQPQNSSCLPCRCSRWFLLVAFHALSAADFPWHRPFAQRPEIRKLSKPHSAWIPATWTARRQQAASQVSIFLHIQKCGGSTVEQLLLRANTDGENFCKFVNSRSGGGFCRLNENVFEAVAQNHLGIDETNADEPRSLAYLTTNLNVLSGHFPYGVGKYFAPRPVRYFTIIREPRSRIISEARYVKQMSAKPCCTNWWPAKLPRDATMPEFLDVYRHPHVDNYQTRMMCSRGAATANRLDVDTAMLQCALRHMEDQAMAAVGIMDDVPTTNCVIAAALGWSMPAASSDKVINPTSSRIEAPAGEIDEKFVLFDNVIYAYAKQRLQRDAKRFSCSGIEGKGS